MSILLTVKKRDDLGSVECWICTKNTTIFNTTIELRDEDEDLGMISLCVEHLDALVSAALARHGDELIAGDDAWYETPDGELSGDEEFAQEELWLANPMC